MLGFASVARADDKVNLKYHLQAGDKWTYSDDQTMQQTSSITPNNGGAAQQLNQKEQQV